MDLCPDTTTLAFPPSFLSPLPHLALLVMASYLAKIGFDVSIYTSQGVNQLLMGMVVKQDEGIRL
ncbi:hypothetical protein L873DRAFT_1808979 [Choiromyces venosus 120613-1]|uniref:Uncharacterized protein n=1 Tax=Choiromyces venosus 120613-1 TaxID=1336337 RepID=A0A3N4JN87_9PEZI|nr:hypothetical protein L873DRAFT_1808979 [Choiromyces venosus 120613-1]